jgi:hypothetical protein
MNTIQALANRYRLKTCIDREDRTTIIPGKLGHLYEVDDRLLGVMVMPLTDRKHHWSRIRAKLRAAEFVILQNGDTEGSASFNPDNPAQARLAIKAVGAEKKRAVSQAQREQRIAYLTTPSGTALTGVGAHE